MQIYWNKRKCLQEGELWTATVAAGKRSKIASYSSDKLNVRNEAILGHAALPIPIL